MPLFDRIDSHASQDRLERLIEERLVPGADKQAIDQIIWKLFGERWAVMFTDLIGFSRNVAEFGIVQFLETIACWCRVSSAAPAFCSRPKATACW
jgi:hypothetical protein